jgi:hypothetical protein
LIALYSRAMSKMGLTRGADSQSSKYVDIDKFTKGNKITNK